MKCSVCAKSSSALKAVRSAFSTYRFFRCANCTDLEPRWLIIMHAHEAGIDEVRVHVKEHRYRGEEIAMAELIE
jgi:hypothetical protein